MFKIFRRVLACFVDMMVVLIIVQTISSIPFINKSLDKYNKVYNNYFEYFSLYGDFLMDLEDYYEDKELGVEEYDKLVSDNDSYKELVDKYYVDGKLSSKNYDKLKVDVNDIYLDNYKDTYYKLDKYSIVYNISYVVVSILYFVGFNMITNGVTLGKKLTRLRIVNSSDNNGRVSIFSYLLRCVMLYQVIYYLFKGVFVNVLGISNYYTVSNIIYDLYSYLTFIILTFVILRKDGRGLHDILCKTKVIEVDRFGNEIVR